MDVQQQRRLANVLHDRCVVLNGTRKEDTTVKINRTDYILFYYLLTVNCDPVWCDLAGVCMFPVPSVRRERINTEICHA